MGFKVRASGSGQIMTDPRKGSKEVLGETAKAYVRRQWIKDMYGREKDIITLAMSKGLHNEEQAITMLSLKIGEMLEKNDKWLENDYITGTADIVTDDCIYDLKCSYDIFSFMEADLSKDYYWQLQCYMALWGRKKAKLVYALTDAPEFVIDAEARSMAYKTGPEADVDSIREAVMKKLTYQDIPEKQKLKIFEVEYDEKAIESLIQRVIDCSDYYDNLTL